MALTKIVGHFGTYVLLNRIGKNTYKAMRFSTHAGFTATFVVKLLDGREATREDRNRVLEEVGIFLRRFNYSKIVCIVEAGEWNGHIFLAMEWVDAVNLRLFLRRLEESGHRLDSLVCCYILAELLSAICHAHDCKVDGFPTPIVHSDIKAENILISSRGDVKLTDFRIARLAAAPDRTLSIPVDTLRYMSPEQLVDRVQLAATDIHAAGIVGYELFHWPKRWLDDVPPEHLHTTVASGYLPEIGGPGIEPWMVAQLRQMLATKPKDRPTAGDAWLNIINRTPYCHLGEQRLAELYLDAIGEKYWPRSTSLRLGGES